MSIFVDFSVCGTICVPVSTREEAFEYFNSPECKEAVWHSLSNHDPHIEDIYE